MKKLFILLNFAFFSSFLFAQDPQFTQFYANQLYLNPAFAGTAGLPKVSLNYRNQWMQMPAALVTYSGSFDNYFNSLHGGLGINLLNDAQSAGSVVSTQIHVSYAYIIRLSHKLYASFGVQSSFIQNSINWNSLVFADMIDPLRGPVLAGGQAFPDEGIKKSLFDFSTGILVYSPQAFIGIAVNHLAEPANNYFAGSVSKLPRKYTVHGGTTFRINHRRDGEPIFLSPNALLQMQGSAKQVNLGAYLRRKYLTTGLWYRQNFSFQPDALILSLGLSLKNFRFSYSYDLPVTAVFGYTKMSHEVAMVILFPKYTKAKKLRAISCPEF